MSYATISVGAIHNRLIVQPGAKLTKNQYGTDLLTRTYFGFTDEIRRLIPPKYSSDNLYNQMYLVGYGIDDEMAGTSMVNVEYKGFTTGVPGVHYSNSQTIQTAQATAKISYIDPTTAGTAKPVTITGQCSISVSFYAPQTTWSWLEVDLPTDFPRYSGVNNQVNPFTRIIRYTATDDQSAAYKGVVSPIAGDVNRALNELVPIQMVTNYQVNEIVPGRIWECTSTVIRTLQSP